MFNNDTNKIKSSKIIGIQFSVLSPHDIRKGSVAEINSRDTYINNKPVLNGLFDPRMGIIDAGLICPTDGLDYIDTPGYFGHINLARPVFYIQYINTLIKILRCICIKCGKLKLSKKKYDFLLNELPKKRWDFVFSHANKIKRCGDETEDGCGCKQPKKIYKQDLAEIFAEWENTSGITNTEGAVHNKPTIKLTAETVLRIFKRISNEDIEFMGFSPIWSKPEWFICQVLAVPPPAVRPSVKHDSQQRSEDDISHIIVNIIKANKTLQDKIQQGAASKVIDDWTTVLQYYIATMIDNKIPGCCPVAQRSGRALKSIKERLVGKQGRVRGNLQGKRVDFSARSVISPDANISIKELGVPLKIAKNITFPNKVNKRNKKYLRKLVLNGPEIYPGANILERKNGDSISLRYVNRETLEINEGDIVHRHLVDGDPVLFNRQPTLHRMSMMCHTVKVMKVGNTFRMNVADTKPYNADFDGDEMNMHGPQSEMAQCELLELAAVPHQIISPADNQSIVGIFQDSLLGCYRFTRKDITFNERTAMNLLMYNKYIDLDIFKNGVISSFNILSQILPPMNCKFPNKQFSSDEDKKTSNKVIEIINGKYIRGQIDKGVLGGKSTGLILSIFNDYNYKYATSFIDELQSIITEYMKLSSYSVGIHDLIANDGTNQQIHDAVFKNKEKVKKLENQLHFNVFENNSGKSNNVEFETQVNSILNKAQEEAGKIGRKSLDEDNRFVIMVNAGSKGNNINIVQMISCLGQQNVDGKRIPYGFDDRTLPHYTKYDDSPEARGFVENSFIQGLTPEELYFHAMGGRTGLIDTAVKTSSTGYIQRRLIKSLEDLCVKYDMSVRNNKNKIIQFKYGTDGINTMKVENIKLPIVSMTTEEIFAHFQIPNAKDVKNFMISNYNKETQKRFKKQKKILINKTKKIINMMIKKRTEIAKHVFNNEDDINIYIPVNFYRIINNVQNNLYITNNNIVDITPMELYDLIEEKLASMSTNFYVKPSKLFKVAWYYYLSPKDLLTVRRFNKKAIIHLLNILEFNYKKSIVNPGEMVGMVAAQSIGEPTTQLSVIGESTYAIVKVERQGKKVSHEKYKIKELCDSFIKNYPQYTFPTGHVDSVETLLDKLDAEYYIMGVSENEKTCWSKISHFSRHPVNGDMMTVTTKSGRTVTTTLSHSHLTRKDNKVQPIKGSDLKIGMRIPVCKHIDNEFVNKTVEIGDKTYNLDKLFGWFIGAYIAKGSCNKNTVCIANSSQHYIDMTTRVGEMFGAETNQTYGPIQFQCKELAEFLVKECGPLKVPDFIFTAPLKCKSAFIQGYMDCVGNINCFSEIICGSHSHRLVKDMGVLFNYFDIFVTFREVIIQNKPFYHFAITRYYSKLYKEHIGSVLQADSLRELCDYGNTSLSDVDKIEGLGEIIEKCLKDLKLPGGNITTPICRKTLKKYIKKFKKAIGEERILKYEMEMLEQAVNSDIIWDEIKHIKIYTPDQKEYVYDFTVPANQTFMDDNGVIVHNTLNTFHFAGVASKSNVTRGVPRIEEILSLSENPKNPSVTIKLKQTDETNLEKAQEIKYNLEYTNLRDITDTVSICFDPNVNATNISEDKNIIEEYLEFEKMMEDCGVESEFSENDKFSKWIIRFELSKENMLEKNISMDEVHFAIKNSLKNKIHCVYSDFNNDNLIFRIRGINLSSNKKKTLDQSDEIHILKNLQNNILNNIILRGIKKIPKIIIRKVTNELTLKNGNYVKEEKWVLDTVGTNLIDVLAVEDIDANNTITNDIQEVYRTLGIEAARQSILNELQEAISFDGTYIDTHHLTMLADRITATKKMVSVFRHGINNDDIGPIAKASFEETPEMFLRASRHGEMDLMTGVSSNVMVGQEGYFGTGSFQILLNLKELLSETSKIKEKQLEQEENIDEQLIIGSVDDPCSKDKIIIESTVEHGVVIDSGNIADDYQIDF
jgi:DNA-directed RNA polymerase beta' subunit